MLNKCDFQTNIASFLLQCWVYVIDNLVGRNTAVLPQHVVLALA